MNCRNSDLPDTALTSPLRLRQISIYILRPGPVACSVSRACFYGNDPTFPARTMGHRPTADGWATTYPLARWSVRGTIFPTLDFPFAMGRCRI
ncbi:MAG: hypothetical protein V8S93_15155 [Lachnospiraceae bacterium]